MLPAERRMAIVELLKESGSIVVLDLSKKFDVSEGTIRRDLRILEKKKLLERTYGGAVPQEGTAYDPPLSLQKEQFVKEKEGIAKADAQLIDKGDTIFVDSSSTNLYLVKAMKEITDITIVTNGVEIGSELMKQNNKSVIITGGDLRAHTGSLVGKLAERVLSEFYLDKSFIGVSAISIDRGMSTGTIVEADLKKWAIRSAKQVIAVTDSSKFSRDAFVVVGKLDELDAIITDSGIPQSYIDALDDLDVQVVVAE